MKNSKYIWAGTVIAVLLVAAWWLWKSRFQEPTQTAVLEMTNRASSAPNQTPTHERPSGPEAAPVLVPTNFAATNVFRIGSLVSTNLAGVYRAYEQGLIDKDQLRRAIIAERSKQAVNFYGKVIDQYGQPIGGAKVKGDLELDPGTGYSKYETHYTETDAEGLFSFTGFHGLGIKIWPEKVGYEMGRRGEGYKAPLGRESSPADRAVFTMWKHKGAEPMVHAEIEAGLACDGTPRGFNLLTGQTTASGADLIVTLVRNPVNIVRGKPFGWELTLNIPNGGLIEIQGGYANEAPEGEYQQIVIISMPAEADHWSPSAQHTYFFKSRDGQAFGKMTIKLMANYEPPPTHFEIDAYVNLGGSRNLEIDPAKLTKVGNGNF